MKLVRCGQRHRIDYLELANRLSAPYLDYATTDAGSDRWRRVEERLRLDVRQAVRVARFARTHGSEVVFSLSERVGIPLAFLLPAKVRHVVHMHHPLSPSKLALVRGLRISGRWTRVSVFTRAEAYALEAVDPLAAGRVTVLPGAVDAAFFNPETVDTPELRRTEESTAMSVGLSHRDYATLAGALKIEPAIVCDVFSSSTWSASGSTGAGADVPINFRPHPFLPPTALRARYARSRFVVVPIRRTTQWSAGVTAVLEAQAMGKAVIASRSPGLSDYVRNGETGLLVDPGQPAALAEAMRFLCDNPEVAQNMGSRARDWVASHFSLEHWLDKAAELVSF